MPLTIDHLALIELCVDKEKDQLKNHTEVILLVAHACLITQKFQCVGKNTVCIQFQLYKNIISEKFCIQFIAQLYFSAFILQEYELIKHNLPNNWNSGNGPYELRYMKNAVIYTLNGSLKGNEINISLKV